VLTVYGFSLSGNCWKVRQILELTGLPFRWVETDSNAGATRTPEFLRMNPNGKVPLVELDDGAHLTESNAILAHFAEGTSWLPAPGLPRTRVFEWLFFEQYSHEPYIAVARNWIRYLKAKERYADRLPDIWERGYRALALMERRLAEHSWLTDSGMTIADIALFAYTHVAEEGEFDLGRFPGVRAWLDRVRLHPGIRPISA
jgi:glutathione S-transferase